MRIEELEQKLKSIRQRMEKFLASWGSSKGWTEEHRQLSDELHAAEREFSKAKGEEYAVPCDLGVSWDTGAPLPHLLCSGDRTFLIFLLNEPNPAWDGTYVTIKDPASGVLEPLALVEFQSATVKFGSPNDEVIHGHPLHGKGLMPYGAHYVVNSRWARELEEINKVHARFDPDRWKEVKHYLFAFHDETFECLALSHQVELYRTSMRELVESVARKLIS